MNRIFICALSLIIFSMIIGTVNAATITIEDPIGDVAHDFIDIKRTEITADDSSLTVRIELGNIPNTLLFSKEGISQSLDYEWSLYIDIDNNENTGCPSCLPFEPGGTEYSISSKHYKWPMDQQPYYDTLIEGTRHDVWRLNLSIPGWNSIGQINAYTDANNLIMTTSLFNISTFNSAKFIVKTFYDDGNGQIEYDLADLPTPIPTPTVSPTVAPISGGNIIRGTSFNIIGIMILTICLIFISFLRIRKR